MTSSRKNHLILQIILIFCGLIPLILIYFLHFDISEKWTMFGLIGIAGFFIGGLYDTASANEILEL